MGRRSYVAGAVHRLRADAVGGKPMTTADHIRIAKRCADSQAGRTVSVPAETLAWLIERAELGCELVAAAVELAER